MPDERRNLLLEEYDDIVLSLLMDDYAELDGQRLWAEFEEADRKSVNTMIPPALDKKCKALISSFHSPQREGLGVKRCAKSVAKAAAIMLVLLAIPIATVLSVEAFRVPVLNFILDREGAFAEISFASSAMHETQTHEYMLRFEASLPEGYTVLRSNFDSSAGVIYCTNQDGHTLILNIHSSETTLFIDGDFVDYTEISIADHDVMFSDKDGYDLVWLDEESNCVCMLYASGLEIDAFWHLAYALLE